MNTINHVRVPNTKTKTNTRQAPIQPAAQPAQPAATPFEVWLKHAQLSNRTHEQAVDNLLAEETVNVAITLPGDRLLALFPLRS